MRRLTWVFAVIMWRKDSSHVAAVHFIQQRKPDQTARMRRLTWVFAVIMWRKDSSHVAVHFIQQRNPDQVRGYEGSWIFAVLMYVHRRIG